MLSNGLDIIIEQDNKKGCTIISLDEELYSIEIWNYAIKLQKADFKIKHIIKDGIVAEYQADNFDDSETDDISMVMLEYNYDGTLYVCEIDEQRIVIRPNFASEDFLKRKLYECIVDPASIYQQTSVENIQSAELNLSMGSTRSASSDIYYAVHNLIKSLQYSFDNNEKVLYSDSHPPLFLANVQLEDTDEIYTQKLESSFKSQLGKVPTWLNEIAGGISDLEASLNRQGTLQQFNQRLISINQKIFELSKKRVENEHPTYNIYLYLLEVKNKVSTIEDIPELAKELAIPIIAVYEARVLGDYKFNFEALLARSYIELLYSFTEELIKYVEMQNAPSHIIRTQSASKTTEFPIVASQKAHDAILGIIKFSGNSVNPLALKSKIVDEWGSLVSLINWNRDFPIHIRILEPCKSPIDIEILEGNQIDVYTHVDKTQPLDNQFSTIEMTIQKIYDIIKECWSDARIKISPITLSCQHSIIKIKEKEMRQVRFYNSRRIAEANLFKALNDSINNGSKATILKESPRDLIIKMDEQKTNIEVLEISRLHRPKQLLIAEFLGHNFVRKTRNSIDKTVVILNESSFAELEDYDLKCFEDAGIKCLVLDDKLWSNLINIDTSREQLDELKDFIEKSLMLTTNQPKLA